MRGGHGDDKLIPPLAIMPNWGRRAGGRPSGLWACGNSTHAAGARRREAPGESPWPGTEMGPAAARWGWGGDADEAAD